MDFGLDLNLQELQWYFIMEHNHQRWKELGKLQWTLHQSKLHTFFTTSSSLAFCDHYYPALACFALDYDLNLCSYKLAKRNTATSITSKMLQTLALQHKRAMLLCRAEAICQIFRSKGPSPTALHFH